MTSTSSDVPGSGGCVRHRHRLRSQAACLALLLTVCWTPLVAGEFDNRNTAEIKQWTSSLCTEPAVPAYACDSQDTCAALLNHHNEYVRDMEFYFECIKNEVREDTGKIETLLNRKIDELHQSAQKRTDQSKVDMEAAISSQGFDVKYNKK